MVLKKYISLGFILYKWLPRLHCSSSPRRKPLPPSSLTWATTVCQPHRHYTLFLMSIMNLRPQIEHLCTLSLKASLLPHCPTAILVVAVPIPRDLIQRVTLIHHPFLVVVDYLKGWCACPEIVRLGVKPNVITFGIALDFFVSNYWWCKEGFVMDEEAQMLWQWSFNLQC